MSEIVVVGSCNMDLITYSPKLPMWGETICGSKFVVGFGGKGANQSVAAAKLGSSVAMVAKVGNDQYGKDFISNLKDSGVNTEHVMKVENEHTGIAAITVSDNGQNCIIIVPGANLHLKKENVKDFSNLLTAAKVVLCQLEVDLEATFEALKVAKELGACTILNFAPAATVNQKMFKLCDILCLNETEASFLSEQNVVDVKSSLAVVSTILDLGCRSCVITLGENGCVYGDKKTEAKHIPGVKVDAVDTTGAGDCFIGTMAYYLADHSHLDMIEILRRSNIIASESVLRLGTQSSYSKKDNLPSNLFI